MFAVVLVALLVVPLLELYVILQVADVIGGWETIALLVVESLLGSWLVRREGRRTWRAFSAALDQHRPPGREVADGALVIVGGTLLLTPGFLSDVVGFFVLLPITRPLARRLLLRYAARRMARRVAGGPGPSRGGPLGGGPPGGGLFGSGLFGGGRFGGAPVDPPADGTPRRTGGVGDHRGDVIEGEVLDERPEPGDRRHDPLRKRPGGPTPPRP